MLGFGELEATVALLEWLARTGDEYRALPNLTVGQTETQDAMNVWYPPASDTHRKATLNPANSKVDLKDDWIHGRPALGDDPKPAVAVTVEWDASMDHLQLLVALPVIGSTRSKGGLLTTAYRFETPDGSRHKYFHAQPTVHSRKSSHTQSAVIIQGVEDRVSISSPAFPLLAENVVELTLAMLQSLYGLKTVGHALQDPAVGQLIRPFLTSHPLRTPRAGGSTPAQLPTPASPSTTATAPNAAPPTSSPPAAIAPTRPNPSMMPPRRPGRP